MEGCSSLSKMWQRLVTESEAQPGRFDLLLKFSLGMLTVLSQPGLFSLRSQHTWILVGCSFIAAAGFSLGSCCAELMVVMKVFYLVSHWESTGDTRDRLKAVDICDTSSLEMAENQMVWSLSQTCRWCLNQHEWFNFSNGSVYTAHNRRRKQISPKPCSSECSYFSWNTLIFLVHLHIDWYIDLLKQLIKYVRWSCLSSQEMLEISLDISGYWLGAKATSQLNPDQVRGCQRGFAHSMLVPQTGVWEGGIII